MSEHDGKNKVIRYGERSNGFISVATDLRDHVQIDPLTERYVDYIYLDHKQVVQLIHQLTDWLGWIAEL